MEALRPIRASVALSKQDLAWMMTNPLIRLLAERNQVNAKGADATSAAAALAGKAGAGR